METQKQSTLKPDALYRLKTILKYVPISRATWYEGIKNGRFPQPVKLGERTSAWRGSDILAIINGEG